MFLAVCKEYEMKGDIVTCRLYIKVRIAHWNKVAEDYDPDLQERLGAVYTYNVKEKCFVFKRLYMNVYRFRIEAMNFMSFFDSLHWKDAVLCSMRNNTHDGRLFASPDSE